MNELDEEYHRVAVYYDDEIKKCPKFGEALKLYMSILAVMKNIRALCHEDSPEAIKGMIGKEIDGFKITEETYEHARAAHEEYTKRYEVCKGYLKKLSEGGFDLRKEVEQKQAKKVKKEAKE